MSDQWHIFQLMIFIFITVQFIFLYHSALLDSFRMSFLSSPIRCKSILCPPLVSFQPTNIIKPPSAESALAVPLSSSLRFPAYSHSFISSLFFLMFISRPILSAIPCCLLFFQILLKFTQIVEDTSGCSVYTSSLERQQETQDLMNVLCRGKTAISFLRLSLVSLHHMLPSTAPSLNFHNGFLCR